MANWRPLQATRRRCGQLEEPAILGLSLFIQHSHEFILITVADVHTDMCAMLNIQSSTVPTLNLKVIQIEMAALRGRVTMSVHMKQPEEREPVDKGRQPEDPSAVNFWLGITRTVDLDVNKREL